MLIQNAFKMSYNSLSQHVKAATHCKGHLIDLVLTRDSNTAIHDVKVYDDVISDHFPVFVVLDIQNLKQ